MHYDYGGQPCYDMGWEAQLGGERGIARERMETAHKSRKPPSEGGVHTPQPSSDKCVTVEKRC